MWCNSLETLSVVLEWVCEFHLKSFGNNRVDGKTNDQLFGKEYIVDKCLKVWMFLMAFFIELSLVVNISLLYRRKPVLMLILMAFLVQMMFLLPLNCFANAQISFFTDGDIPTSFLSNSVPIFQ